MMKKKTPKIRITTVLTNSFEEIIDLKDFNEESVKKSIESTKKQLREGLKGDFLIQANEEVIWEE